MEFTRKILFSYQVYARQHQSVDDYFSLVQKTWIDCVKGLGYTLHTENTIYIPVKPEDIQKARDAGYLLISHNDVFCLVVRELPLEVKLPEFAYEEASVANEFIKELIDRIVSECSDVFESIEIIETAVLVGSRIV